MACSRSLGLRLLLAGVLLCGAAVLLGPFFLRYFGNALVQAGNPVHADMVVVLAGDFFGDRILKGAELVREGYAPRVLVSGPAGFYGQYECDPAIRFAVAHGYPEQYFVRAPNDARSTEEEAAVLSPAVAPHGRRISICWSPATIHTARAGHIFRARSSGLEVHGRSLHPTGTLSRTAGGGSARDRRRF